MGKIGIDPDKYWRLTFREISLIGDSFEHKELQHWYRARNIEFANYSSQINMNGKKAFKMNKPSDLYLLGAEKDNKTILKGDAANDYLQKLFSNK